MSNPAPSPPEARSPFPQPPDNYPLHLSPVRRRGVGAPQSPYGLLPFPHPPPPDPSSPPQRPPATLPTARIPWYPFP